MQNFGDIIEAFGGAIAFGQALGIPDSHARVMKVRNSISPEHWSRLVEAAEQRGLEGISHKRLADLRAARFAQSQEVAA